jgi:predicted RNA methylase
MAHVTLTPDVLDIIGRSEVSANRVALPPGQLDRKMYLSVKKALEAAGGKWKTNVQAFVFDGDPRSKLGLAIESGVVIDEKKVRQAFYTPQIIAERVVMWANVSGCKVLEPSAGDGALIDDCYEVGNVQVDAIELEPSCRGALEAKAASVRIGDFLSMTPEPIYDRVVMNPPFTKGQDLKHITHALKWLKPGGELYSIVPDKDCPKLAKLGAETVERFAAGAFKSSGTNVATRLISIHYGDE